MKKILTLFALIGSVLTQQAIARCSLAPGASTMVHSVNFPSLINVPSSAPADGTYVIAVAHSLNTLTNTLLVHCYNNGGSVVSKVTVMGAGGTTGNNIYATNVPGVGIRITDMRAAGTMGGLDFPASALLLNNTRLMNGAGAATSLAGNNFKVELIKVGAIDLSQGDIAINGGVIAQVVLDNGDIAKQVFSNRVRIKETVDCAVSIPSQIVNFDTFGPAAFGGTSAGSMGPVQTIDFTITCNGSNFTAIKATISAKTDTADASSIATTGMTSASGLGIRIMDKKSGVLLIPNDPDSSVTMPTLATGQPAAFSFDAVLVKVAEKIAPGKFSGTATVNLTIE